MNKQQKFSKRPSSPGRRTAKADSGALLLTSWSGLEEYLRFAPDKIVRIGVPPRDERKLESLLSASSQRPSVRLSEDFAGLEVEIEIRAPDEAIFLEQISKDVRQKDLIVACDHVTDTRNLGAIARTAVFFGSRHVLLPKDRQAPITNATLGTAQGAFALLAPVFVTNLGRTLEALKEKGYWIIAADMDGQPLAQFSLQFDKVVLVLGAEDRGLSPNIKKKCDVLLSISGAEASLESLNVSVASGILIHALFQGIHAVKKNPAG